MRRARGNGRFDGTILTFTLSVAFLAFSFVRIIGDAGSAAFSGGLAQFALSQPIWGTQLGANLAWFVSALLLIHCAVAVAAWLMARLTLVAFPGGSTSQRALAVFWLALGAIWVLAANARWYPRSSLGAPYADTVAVEWAGLSAFALLSTGLAAAIVAVAIVALARTFRSPVVSRAALATAVGGLAVGVALPAFDAAGNAGNTAQFEQPHVILIGLDSLRTDVVQDSELNLTPAIDRYLDDAVVFSNAYTPLARTFPSWVSIISGKHPHTTGAFVNLLPRELIDEGTTLPQILREQGYKTVYAIDEVRFSNLDTSYGFDEMLAPAMGSADFLLGFFADTPLANVVANTRAGAWLFPFAYANRAAASIYDPDTFIERIEAGVEFDRPTLLAVHFTLAHWPYLWAEQPVDFVPEEAETEGPGGPMRLQYHSAASRLDAQFDSLMDVLADKGALDNAIVVVLSDHGESLGEHQPVLEAGRVSEPAQTTATYYGHGTHVLSRDQYNVILGLKSYGNETVAAAETAALDLPVSLLDVTPSILDLLEIDHSGAFDGRSLKPYIEGDADRFADAENRVRFVETEFNPPGFSPGETLTTSAITSAADKYQIDPETDRVLIRRDFIEEMLSKRQYAVELNGEFLASVPATGNPEEQFLLFFDSGIESQNWLDEPPVASQDPARFALWQSLEQRFDPVRRRPVVTKPDWPLPAPELY